MAKKEMEVTATHLPADLNLAEQIRKDLEVTAAQVESSSVERIRMSAKGFTTPDGATGKTIKGVIVDFASANSYYEGAYDRDNPAPPVCYAVAKIPSQLAPDPTAPQPQATTCAECPKNQFESGVGKSKACKNTRALAVIQENATEDSPIWVLSVPPKSLRYFDTYVSTTLRGRHNVTPICVVTEIYMDENQEFAAPRFRVDRILEEEELRFYFGRKGEAEAVLLQQRSQ